MYKMAFSFRAGTNWCHDFPKLARESGFYFNMHTARVRVDWNRISSIDIDRVIRERDFQTIDDNVNNVIDYYLESEYDVKILDPNFVKLFRLSQLAVEYLLYCKQYLDQSVVILKEELKYKIEENLKQKEVIVQMQNTIKEMKEKLKEKTKVLEIKSDLTGEIHKCPHCPKTFVSASFANAHLLRRHSNLVEMLSNSSPAHMQYRTETEKLHNEIKTLKERLNQTERVIRNDSKKISSLEDGDSMSNNQYRRYQEEISNLKSILFAEIQNIKRKENHENQQDNYNNHENIKDLVNHQESEIHRLRSQLQEHLSSNSDEIQIKLVEQEAYWKSKIEQMENQHRTDIENLFTQLKLTQESAIHMKSEYEEKVTFLEKQATDQSKLLNSQSKQLNNLTKDILDNRSKRIIQSNTENRKVEKQKPECSIGQTLKSESSQNVKKSMSMKIFLNDKQSTANYKLKPNYTKLPSTKRKDNSYMKVPKEIVKETNPSVSQEKKTGKALKHRKITKAGNKYSSLDESDKSESSAKSESETESEEDSIEETSESSATHTESTNDEAPSEPKPKIKQEKNVKKRSSISLDTVREDIQQTFENRLRDLGIDPEWTGIPLVTYNQKMANLAHHQNISSKKYQKYDQIRKKLVEEISRRVSMIQKSPKIHELEKKSFLNKAMKNVKSKALKALTELKVQKSNDTSTPVMSSKNSTPTKSQTKRRFSLELLPKKPTQHEIEQIKKQVKLESSKDRTEEDPPLRKSSNPYTDENNHLESAPTVIEPNKRTKSLQRSYQTIEEFLKDIEESPKQNITNVQVASTSSKNVKNMLQDTSSLENESDHQSVKQDTVCDLNSPKTNKSVLKSASGNTITSVKKKVLFDLEKEINSERHSTSAKSLDVVVAKEEQHDKKESIESYWNIPSIAEEKEEVPVTETAATSSDTIHLKTFQSEKIAAISKKIQEELEASRRKPVGSVEAMFSSKTFFAGSDTSEIKHNYQTSAILTNSVESPSSQIEPKPRSNINQLPQPAPRRQLFETKDYY